MAYQTKAQRQAKFESQPHSPKEHKDHDANEAAEARKAQEFFVRRATTAAESWRDSMSDLADYTHALNVGGAKTVPGGGKSVAEHMEYIQRLRAEVDAAERAAVNAAGTPLRPASSPRWSGRTAPSVSSSLSSGACSSDPPDATPPGPPLPGTTPPRGRRRVSGGVRPVSRTGRRRRN